MSGGQAGAQAGDANLSSGDSEPATLVGTLQVLFGAVTISRPGAAPAHAALGDAVREGDVLDTGEDGVAVIAFLDGSTLHLHANGHLVLDGLSSGPDERTVVRIAKGIFGIVRGTLAAAKPLDIETPAGRLRTRSSAVGLGSIALGVFTFALIRDLKADSADVAFIDNGTVDYKDLKHGVFEIVLEGQNGQPPRVIVVDDPTQTIVIRHMGSGYTVQAELNSPLQMAQYQNAYSHAYSTFSEGQQDPFIQQWQHANAQPQSNPGGTGSSTSLALLNLSSSIQEGPGNNSGPTGTFAHGFGGNNTGNSAGSTGGSANGSVLPTPTAHWQYDNSGNWSDPSSWSDGWAPLALQDLTIGYRVVVTISGSSDDSGPTPTAATDLTIGTGATVDIVSGGTLAISGLLDDSGVIKANSTGVDPTLWLDGTAIIRAGGQVESLGVNAAVYFQDAATPAPGTYSVDNFGTIAAAYSGTMWFEQAATKNEAGALISSAGSGAITFDQGSLDNAYVVTAGASNLADGAIYFEQVAVTNEAGAWIMAQNSGKLAFDGGTLVNAGTVAADGGTLSLNSGVAVTNEIGGVIIAEDHGTLILDAGNTITSQDQGLLEATSGGVIHVKDSAIYNGGTHPLAAIDPAGILVDGSGSELLIDVAVLTLSGGGTLALTGGEIAAASAGEELINVDNIISGYGTISNLAVTNERTIEATGGTLIQSGTTVDNSDHVVGDPVGTVMVAINAALDLDNATITNGSINNAGAIVSEIGTNTISDVASFANDQLSVVSGTTLDLTNDPDIIGGTITVQRGAVLNLTNVTISGAVVDNEGGTINLFGVDKIDTIQSQLTGATVVESGQTLSLLDETIIGSITVDGPTPALSLSAGVLNIETNNTIIGNDLTYHGGLLNSGQIDVLGADNIIEDDYGAYAFTNAGTLTVDAGGQLTLASDTVNNTSGTITVDAGTAAGALTLRSTTVNNGTIVNHGTLDLVSGNTIDDAGTLSNGGLVEVSGGSNAISAESLVTNSGTIAIDNGGVLTLASDGAVDNSATVEVLSGGQLTLTSATVSNSGVLTVASGGAAALTATTITQSAGTGSISNAGAVTLAGTATINNGALDNTATGHIYVTAGGNAIDNEATTGNVFTNAGHLEVEATAALTLASDTVNNTSGTITVDAGTAAGALTLRSTTVNNGTIVNHGTLDLVSGNTIDDAGTLSNSGLVEVSGGSNAISAESLVTNSGTIAIDNGGVLTLASDGAVDNSATVEVLSGGQLTLTSATVSNSGVLTVASGGAAALTATTITQSAGTGSISNAGAVTLAGTATINNGALDNTATGHIYVTAGGNAIDNEATTGNVFTNAGHLEVEATAALTLASDTVNNTSGTITVDAGTAAGALTLRSTTVNNGTIVNHGTLDLVSGNTIDDAGTLSNGGLVEVSGGSNAISAESLVTNSGTIAIDNGGVLTLASDGAVDNSATVEVLSGGQLTLTSATVSNSGVLTVASGGAAALTATTITQSAGTGSISNAGAVTLAGTATINNGALDNTATGHIYVTAGGNAIDNEATTGNVFTNAGHLEVEATAALTLASDTVNNTSGTITVDAGTAAGALTLRSTTVNNGTIVNHGTLDLVSGNTIDDAGTLSNSGLVEVSGGSNAISAESLVTNSGTIAIDNGGVLTLASDGAVDNSATVEVLSGGQLTLTSATVSNSGVLTVASGGAAALTATTITQSAGTGSISNAGAVTLAGTATITNGALDNTATGHIYVTAGGNAIDNEATTGNVFTNAGHLEVEATAALTLASDTVNNTSGTITVDAGTAAGALTLRSTTVNNGTIVNHGTLDLVSGNTIDDAGTLSNSGLVEVSGGSNAISAESLVTNSGTIAIDNGGVLTLASDGAVDNSATVEVLSGGQLTLTSATVSNSGVLTVASGGAAALTATTITQSAGTGSISNAGAVTLAGTATINNGALDNTATGHIYVTAGGNAIDNEATTGNVFTNAGHLEVEATAALTLASDTVNNTSGTITVDAGTAAGALTLRSTTVNNGTIVNHGTLDLVSGNTIDDAGTLSNSGLVEVSGGSNAISAESLVTNSGTIAIDNGGVLTLASDGAVDNSATVEVLSGGQLTLTSATVSNSGVLTVASGGAAALTATTITQSAGTGSISNAGAVTLAGTATINNGALDNTATGHIYVTAGGNAIDNEATTGNVFTNAGHLEVEATAALTLASDTVNNTSGTITVDAGTAAGALTLRSTTVNNGTIVNHGTLDLVSGNTIDDAGTLSNGGLVEVSGGSNAISAESLVTNSGTIAIDNGGVLTLASDGAVDNSATVEVLSGGQLTLTSATVSNSGVLTVASGGAAALTATTITQSAGTGSISNAGAVTLAGTATINNGALDNTATGHIYVTAGGNAIDNEATTGNVFTNAGHLEVEATAALTLASDTVNNTSGTITVDAGTAAGALTLRSTTVNNGTIVNHGTLDLVSGNTIDDAGTLSNSGLVEVSGGSNAISAESLVTNSGTIAIDNGGVLTLASDGAVDNSATVEVLSGGQLTLTSATVSNSGVLTVASGGAAALTATTITQSAGTGSISNAGAVTLAGTATINNGALDNTATGHIYVTAGGNAIDNEATTGNVFTNAGHLEVEATAALTLASDTVNNTSGTITVDAGTAAGALTLRSTTVNNGTIVNHGTLDLVSGNTIDDAGTLSNGGLVEVSGGSNAISAESLVTNSGTIAIDNGGVLTLASDGAVDNSATVEVLSGGQLTLTSATVSNSGVLTVASGGAAALTATTITQSAGTGSISNAGAVTLAGTATITNGALDNTATGHIYVTAGGNAIDNEATTGNVFTNAGHLEVEATAALTLASDTVNNTSGTITVDAGTAAGALTLRSTTVNNGTIVNHGTLDLVSGNTIDDAGTLSNSGLVEVSGGSNAISAESLVTNSGTIAIDNGGVLTLASDGAVDNSATVEVLSGGQLTLTSATVSNSGVLTVASGGAAALTATTITQSAGTGSISNAGAVTLAGTATINNGALDNTATGHIYVTAGGNAIDNEATTGNVFTNAGHLEVEATAALTLASDTVNNTSGTITVDAGTAAGALTLRSTTVNNGTIVNHGTLDLVSGNTIDDAGTLSNGGLVEVSGGSNAISAESLVTNSGTIAIDNGGVLTLASDGAVDNSATVEVLSGGQLTLTSATVSNSGVLTVASGGAAALTATTITQSAGTGSITNAGAVTLAGTATITNGALDNTATGHIYVTAGGNAIDNEATTGNVFTNAGHLEVEATAALTLASDTVNNTSGTITVDAGTAAGALTLRSTTVNNGTIVNHGTLDLVSGNTIDDAGTLSNSGLVEVSGGSNAISAESLVTNSGTIAIDNGGVLTLASDGAVDNSATVEVLSGGQLTLTSATVSNSGVLTVASGGAAALTATTITQSAGTGSISNAGAVTLAGTATITNGALDNTATGHIYVTAGGNAIDNEATTGNVFTNAGHLEVEATAALTLASDTVNNTSGTITVDAGTAAGALTLRSTTVNNGTIVNHGTLDLVSGNTIDDAGTLSNSGLVEVSGGSNAISAESLVTNSGTIAIDNGGVLTLASDGAVDNSATVEVLSGGQLTLTSATVSNSGVLTVASGGAAALTATTITQSAGTGSISNAGAVTLAGTATITNGALDNTATGHIYVTAGGNAIDNEATTGNVFTNAGHLEVEATAALTLASDTVNNTSGTITVDAGTAAGALTLRSTTVNNGTIVNHGTLDLVSGNTIDDAGTLSNSGLVEVSGGSNAISAESLVTNSGTIAIDNGGVLTLASDGAVDNSATVEVLSGGQLTLTSATVSNSGVLTVASGGAAALTATTITQSAGTGSISNAGAVTLAGTATINNGALDNTATGHIYVTAGGNAIDNEATTGNVFTNAGHLEVEATAALTLASDTVNNTSGTITVDAGTAAGALTLRSTTVNNGTIVNHGTLDLVSGNTIDDAGTLSNGGLVEVSGGSNAISAESLVTNSGTIAIDNGGVLTLASDGAVDNSATVEVLSGGQLTLTSATVSNSGVLTVASGGAAALTATTITQSAGTGSISNAGAVTLAGTATITNGALDNTATGHIYVTAGGNAIDNEATTGNVFTNAGHLEVEATAALTLASDTVNNTSGTITVDAGTAAGALTLRSTTVNNGTIVNHGTLDLVSGNTIDDAGTLSNSGLVEVSGGSNAISAESLVTNSGTIAIDNGGVLTLASDGAVDNSATVEVLSGGQLTLTSATVSNSGVLTVASGGAAALTATTITQSAGTGSISNAGAVTLAGTATITNGALDNTATGHIYVTAGGNAIDNEATTGNVFTNAGHLEVEATAALTLASDTVNNTSGTITVDAGTAAGALTLRSTTVNNGTIVNHGTLDLVSGNTIDDAGTLSNSGLVEVSGGSNAISAESLVTNSGTIAIDNGGVLTLASDGAVDNSATVEVLSGGQLTLTSATVSNSGVLTVASGGAAALTATTITQSAGTGSISNAGAVTLAGTATITNGALDNTATGHIYVTAGGNAIDNEATTGNVFTNAGHLEVEATAALTLASDTVNNTSGTITVDAGTAAGALTLRSTTVNNGTIVNHGTLDLVSGNTIDDAGTLSNSGLVEVSGGSNAISAESLVTNSGTIAIDNGGVLTLASDGAVDNSHGTITVQSSATLNLSGVTISGGIVNNSTTGVTGDIAVSGTNAAFDGVTLNNTGLISVSSGAILTFDGTDTISGGGTVSGAIDVDGTVTFDGGGTISVGSVTVESGHSLAFGTGTSMLIDTQITDDGSMTVSGTLTFGGNSGTSSITSGSSSVSTIDNTGTFAVANSASVTLSGVAIGGSITVGSSATLTVGTTASGASGATFDGASINNTGTISVALGALLTLDDTDTISGTGTVSGAIDVDGAVTFEGGGTISAGSVIVESSHSLTFGGGTSTLIDTQITDNGSITVSGKLTFGNSGSGVTISSANSLGTVVNNGTMDVQSAATISDVSLNNSAAQITVESNASLTLEDGTTVTGGALTVNSSATLYIENGSGSHGATLDGVDVQNSGTIQVDPAVQNSVDLVLTDGTTISGDGTISIGVNGPGEVEIQHGSGTGPDYGATFDGGLTVNGAVTVDASATLTFNTVTLESGTITNKGVIAVTGAGLTLAGATIDGGTINNTGGISVSTPGEIDDHASLNGSVTVQSNATLTLDDVTYSGTLTNSSPTSSIVKVDGSNTLWLDGATISGGTLINSGTIEVTANTTIDGVATLGGAVMVAAGAMLTLDGASIIGGGTIEANGAGAVVALDGVTLTGATVGVTANGGTAETTGAGSTSILDGTAQNDVAAIAGSFDVTAGTALELQGYVQDGGTLTVNGTAGSPATLLIDGTVTLSGDGDLGLAGGQSIITGDGTSAKLVDVNDTISGTGLIGDGQLSVDNQSEIASNLSGSGITIDTGSGTFTNEGFIVSNGTGGFDIESAIQNTAVWSQGSPDFGIVAQDGTITIQGAVTGGGNAVIDGGNILFESSSTNAVIFVTGAGGTLGIAEPTDFSGSITGYGSGDTIDLSTLSYASSDYAVWTQSSTTSGGEGTLAIYNDSGVLQQSLNLDGIYAQGEFALASDSSTLNAGNPGTDVKFNAISFNDGQINQESTQYDHYAPQIGPAGNTLQLTNDLPTEAASWFDSTKVSVAGFTASFDYQATPLGGGLADGFAFILQDSSAGLSALGADGGELGYGPNDTTDGRGGTAISRSAAVELNLYDQGGSLIPGTNFATNGSTGSYNPTGGVDFADSGDTIQVVLSYNGSTLTEALTDLVTGVTYSTSYTENLESILGSDTAYVGFSAGNGGGQSTQIVSNFNYGQLSDIWTDGANDGSWTTAGNWSDGFAPVAGQTAVILSGGSPTIESSVTINDVTVQDGGTITVATHVTVALQDATISGPGTISNNGTIDVTGSSAINNALLDEGALTIASGVTLTLDDVVLHNVAVTVSSDGTTPSLQIDASQTLTYTGTDSLDGNAVVYDNDGRMVYLTTVASNLALDIFEGSGTVTREGGGISSSAASVTVMNEGNTFDGYGTQGGGNGQLIFEQTAGAVDADFAGQTYAFDPGGTASNAGTFEATNGGILLIESTIMGDRTVIDNTGGTGNLQADAGSEIELSYATIDGGTVSTAATGLIDVTDSSTIDGNATLSGEVMVAGGQTLTLDDVAVNNSTITLAGGDGYSLISDPLASSHVASDGTGPAAINNSGEVVGSYFDANYNLQGFLYAGGSYSNLEVPSATGTIPFAINDSGEVVGMYYVGTLPSDTLNMPSQATDYVFESGPWQGFLYNNGVYTTLNDPSSGAVSTEAFAINNSGEVVGIYTDTNGANHGFVYENGNYTTLDAPSAGTGTRQGTIPFAVNNAGQIVGAEVEANGSISGFLYSNGAYTALNDPSAGTGAGEGTIAFAINNVGQVVGTYIDASGNEHGFVYSNGTFTTLDDPAAATGSSLFSNNDGGTDPKAINDNGEVVGTYEDASGNEHGFVYDNGTYTTENGGPGASGAQTYDINDAAQVLGAYYDGNGTVGFVGGPSSATLMLDGTTIDGGTINGSGTIDVTGPSTIEGNATVAGDQIVIASGETLTLDDVVLYNVAVTISSDGTTPSIQIEAGETLTWAGASAFGGPGGSGDVIIDNNGHIVHAGTLAIGFSQITFEGSGTVTENGGNSATIGTTIVNEGNTFDGYGGFGGGTSGSTTLINEAAGTIDADAAGHAFTIDTGNTVTNAGTFEATDGGILLIESTVMGDRTVIDNTGGTGNLQADAGSEIELSHATIDGGTVSTALTGQIDITGSSMIDDGANVSGAIMVESAATLTLDGVTDSGGTINNTGGTVQIGLAYSTVNDPGEAQTSLVGINNLGEIVGYGADGAEGVGGAVHDYIVGVGNFDVGPDGISAAGGVNDSGDIVGDADGFGGYLYVAGNVTALSAFAGGGAEGIDDAGDIVGVVGGRPIIDVDGTGTVLNPTDTDTPTSVAISANGTIVISYASGSVEGTPAGGFDAADVPVGAVAQGINDEGQIVGFTQGGDYNSTSFLDDDGTIYAIAVPGATGTQAYGINDSGEIVGYYTDADHNTQGFTTTVAAVEAAAVSTLTLSGSTISGGTVSIAATGMLTGDGSSAIDNATITNNGELVTGGTFTLDGDTVNGGILTGDASGASYNLDQYQTLTLNGVTVEADHGADATLDNAGAMTLGTSLTLSPSGGAGDADPAFTLLLDGAGTVALNGAAITATGSGEVLENNGNTISGGGTIGNGNADLKLDNAAGTIEALGGTLTLDTGNTITNASGATLEAGAAIGSILQVDDSTIDNAGTIQVDGTLVVGVPSDGTLALTGHGTVTLAGGAISSVGADGGDTLMNSNNTISGYGEIGIASPNVLNIHNGGTIEALAVGTDMLSIINAGMINNSGTLEAASGAILDIGPNGINNGGNIQVDGTLSISDVGGEGTGSTFTLAESGTVTLVGGTISTRLNAITGVEETFTNTGNTISGYGQIGDGTDDHFALTNSSGTIEALGGTLTIDTLNTVTNAGTLEAGAGGTLIVVDNVSGTGSVTLTGGGIADFQAGLAQNVTFTGDGTLELANPATFSGTISGITKGDANQVIDLGDLSAGSNDTFTVTATFANVVSGETTLVVTDNNNNNSEQVLLVGNESTANGYNWSANYDGNVGADVFDPVPVVAAAAAAIIAAGTNLDITTASTAVVTFAGGAGSLVLSDPEAFAGQITGFTGTAPDATHSDVVDLVGINYDSSQFAENYNSTTGLLTVTDGTHSASITFDNFNATLDFASDGNGGTDIFDPPSTGSAHDGAPTATDPATTADTVNGNLSSTDSHSGDAFTASATPDGSGHHVNLALDQPDDSNGHAPLDHVRSGFDFMSHDNHADLTASVAERETQTQSDNKTGADARDPGQTDAHHPAQTETQPASVSIGGPGNDHFVFHADLGADNGANANPQHETVEHENPAQVQTAQELQALLTHDVHGDAAINLDHHDAFAFANETHLQHVIQAGHLLLH